MKLAVFSFLLVSFLCSCSSLPSSKKVQLNSLVCPETQYKHIVLFSFKSKATATQIADTIQAFQKLPSQVKTIQTFSWGKQISPEKLSAGITHCFTLTFRNKKDFMSYLHHPTHQKFVDDYAKKYVAKAIVVDYLSMPKQK